MSMVEVMQRGGRGHLVTKPFNKTRLQRVVSRATLSRCALRVVTTGCIEVKLDNRLGLLSRCLFPELMGEKMTILDPCV